MALQTFQTPGVVDVTMLQASMPNGITAHVDPRLLGLMQQLISTNQQQPTASCSAMTADNNVPTAVVLESAPLLHTTDLSDAQTIQLPQDQQIAFDLTGQPLLGASLCSTGDLLLPMALGGQLPIQLQVPVTSATVSTAATAIHTELALSATAGTSNGQQYAFIMLPQLTSSGGSSQLEAALASERAALAAEQATSAAATAQALQSQEQVLLLQAQKDQEQQQWQQHLAELESKLVAAAAERDVAVANTVKLQAQLAHAVQTLKMLESSNDVVSVCYQM